MKIIQVIDSPWAIGALAKVIEEKNSHLEIKTMTVHPKELRQNPQHFIDMLKFAIEEEKPDIVHFHYWDVANTLRPHIPEGIKVMLTHHNQKNLLTHDWTSFDMLVVHTKKALETLTRAGYSKVAVIQHGIDIERFQFKEEYDDSAKLLGYVGRIVPWKGLYEILESAKNLETEVIMMGKIDKADYWNKCLAFSDQMNICFNTPKERQVEVYHEMTVYIGNSDDNIEEGPLGLLEAMACGIPVITTPSGEGKDIIEDRKNGLLVPFNDQQALENKIKDFFSMPLHEKNKMRENAWNTVKNMTEDRMAYQYQKLYWKVKGGKDLVSVIIPTCNRMESIKRVIDAYAKQTYENIEIIICDDGSSDDTVDAVQEASKAPGARPMVYTNTNNPGYGLAQARNQGIFEASGHYLVFSDDRMCPEPDAVERLVATLSGIKQQAVVWGQKDPSSGRSFIENFFAIRKKDMVSFGMFNERGNEYGFQSQEVRERLFRQGFTLVYEPLAKATPLFGTRRGKRRYEIARSKFRLYKLNN